MGFFLSKLLPQLIYPLGLGLLLQLIAIGGRKRRWALPLSITGWLVIAVPAMPVVSDALLRQLEDEAAELTPKPSPRRMQCWCLAAASVQLQPKALAWKSMKRAIGCSAA